MYIDLIIIWIEHYSTKGETPIGEHPPGNFLLLTFPRNSCEYISLPSLDLEYGPIGLELQDPDEDPNIFGSNLVDPELSTRSYSHGQFQAGPGNWAPITTPI